MAPKRNRRGGGIVGLHVPQHWSWISSCSRDEPVGIGAGRKARHFVLMSADFSYVGVWSVGRRIPDLGRVPKCDELPSIATERNAS